MPQHLRAQLDVSSALRLTAARQALRDEQALPPADPARRENAVIAQDLQQAQRNLDAQYVLQDATTAAVRREGELLGSSPRTRRSPCPARANQTTYFVDFKGPTSVGTCFDNSDIRMQQDVVCSNTPCYRTLCIHNLDGQRHHNNSSFKNGYKTSLPTR